MNGQKLFMIVDIDRCWGCKACQVACKREHGLAPEDFKPVEVFRVENEQENRVRCDFLPVACQHCDAAACVEVCPRKALVRTGEGAIRVEEDLCVGCGLCFKKCPYGAIGLKIVNGKRKAVKCDLCMERRERGFLPACEQHCLGGVFTSCTAAEKETLLEPYPYRWQTGCVIYVSRIRSGLGKALNG